jgi:hypothetical protein
MSLELRAVIHFLWPKHVPNSAILSDLLRWHGADLAPHDCWLSWYLKQCHEGRFFEDDISLRAAVAEILASIEPDMFVRMFAEWRHWLQQCIDPASLLIRLSGTRSQASRHSAPPGCLIRGISLCHFPIEQIGWEEFSGHFDCIRLANGPNSGVVALMWRRQSKCFVTSPLKNRDTVCALYQRQFQAKVKKMNIRADTPA